MYTAQYPTFSQVQEIRKQLRDAEYSHWLHHDLFSFNFWLLLVVAFAPWWLWFRLRDRSRSFELLYFGLLLGMISTFLDALGTNLLLWGYKDQIFGVPPPLFPADVTLMSVPFMLIYEKLPAWKNFTIAVVLLSALYAFVREQLLECLGIYELTHWKHIYSFPIYIALPCFVRWMTVRLRSGTAR
ncbi:CBO0543 family protein [Tumebacillus flagellatus]|uniref:Uncharacterized protein n=1 Tax=Tumebacillus flagellatus TaxID=1157490 RepID=A0A074MDC7_9BACL|nr:CBO0543 family protein [Tumebacillus flagellatus]KEO83862.1 hypothetical protein EL26_08065 [Tumebacillus flagellatus]